MVQAVPLAEHFCTLGEGHEQRSEPAVALQLLADAPGRRKEALGGGVAGLRNEDLLRK